MRINFDEVFEDVTKYGTKIKTDEYHQSGKYPIIDQGLENIAGYTDLEDGAFENIPAIIFGDHTRIVKYADAPFFLGADGVKVLRSRFADANYRYLYYALKNVKVPNTGYNRHFKWLKDAKISYPNTEKQNEIVAILDKTLQIIECRQKQLQKLDDLVKARFVELFGDPIANSKGWKKGKLESHINLLSGYPFPSEQYVISNEIKNFISSSIEYEVYDFSYTTSEYELLKGKKFQMLVVKDTPERIPFLAEKESGSLKQNMIYVRRGTSCEVANQEELNDILRRRINFMHPLNGEPLELKEHLNQLKTLYESTEKNTVHYNSISSEWTKKLLDAATEFTFGKRIGDPNPFYPEEAYDAFVARMISEKKKKIERVLDLY